jgi:O-antigen/teichoic acid export membrane protein
MTEVGPAPSSAAANLFRRGSLYTLTLAVQLVGALAILPIVTRLLNPAEYGRIATVLVVGKLLAVVFTIGVPAAITVEAFREPDGDVVAGTLVTFTAAAAAVLACLAAATAPAWSSALGLEGLSTPLRLAAAIAAMQATQLAGQAMLQARDQVARFVSIAVIGTVIGQLSGLTALLVFDRTATTYLSGVLAANGVAAVVALALAAGSRLNAIRGRFVDVLRLALPTLPHSAALLAMAAGDRIVIGAIDGTAAAGRYDIGYTIGTLSLVILVAFNQAWAPQVYGSAARERWPTLAATTTTVYRATALLAAAAALLAPLGLAAAAPAEYRIDDVQTVATILPFGAVIYVAYLSNVHVIFQERRTMTLAWATPVATAISIGSCIALIPPFGIVGAAAATLLGYASHAFLVHRAAGRFVEVPWRYRPMIDAWLVSGIAIAVALVVPDGGAWSVARACGSVALLVRLLIVVRRS